jgi:hypothetical protein
MPESGEDAYERGHLAGEIAARLAGHDHHFAQINGSIEKTAQSLVGMSQEIVVLSRAIQRLTDQSVADAVTRVTTAAALKEAEEGRRNKIDQRWSPLARTITVILAITSVVSVVTALYLALRPH